MTGPLIRRVVIVLMAGSILAAGCGTRVRSDPGASGVPAGSIGETVAPTAAPPPGTEVGASAATPAAVDSSSVLAPTGGTAPRAAAGAGSATGTAAATPASPITNNRPAASGGPNRTATPTPAGGGAGPATPGKAGAVPAPGTSPVVLASLGTQSGPIGATLKPIVRGMQIWLAAINARGGLNGHPVRVLVFDDGGDPARAKANAKDAIEHKGAIALVANTDVLAGGGSIDYITSKGIPMIGGDHGRTFALQSPMFFPVTAVGPSMYRTAMVAPARYLIPQGKKKLGWLVCVETPICPEADKLWQKEAGSAGWDPVYRGQVSVAQPDYTAECLAARSAGAEVLIVILDASSFERFARSCVRQNYRPTLVGGPGVTQADRMKGNPDLEGMVALGLTFPYFQKGTPATDEFQEAVKQYAPGEVSEQGTSQGWASAKLLEKAAAQLGEPPTSAAILKGLWAINGDTLGGLTEPLAFHENQLPDPKGCWFTYITKQGSWVSPDNFALHCL